MIVLFHSKFLFVTTLYKFYKLKRLEILSKSCKIVQVKVKRSNQFNKLASPRGTKVGGSYISVTKSCVYETMKVARDSLGLRNVARDICLVQVENKKKKKNHQFVHLTVPIYVVNNTSYCFDFK